MTQSLRRIFCAFILMGLGLAISVGILAGAAEQELPSEHVWIRLPMEGPPNEEIRLYESKGSPLFVLQTDLTGLAVAELLPPGSYYAVTSQGCSYFSLSATAQVNILGGCGCFDGTVLRLLPKQVGSVTVAVESPSEQTWLSYRLIGAETVQTQVLRCDGRVQTQSCHFQGLPYGSYVLEENGIRQCRITLSAETPNVSISLP